MQHSTRNKTNNLTTDQILTIECIIIETFSSVSIVDYVKKIQDRVIKHAVNYLVEARRRDGKLYRNANSSAIDAIHKAGVEIDQVALYKRIKREFTSTTSAVGLVYDAKKGILSVTKLDDNDDKSSYSETGLKLGSPKSRTNAKK